MRVKILCPLWGNENGDIEAFMERIANAGFDGIDTWLPEDKYKREQFLKLGERFNFLLVTHQHQANGDTFKQFKSSFLNYLDMSREGDPLFINSHTGKDYFSFNQNLELIDLAQTF